jgi:sulfur relay protein TusB/DsrH
MNVLLLTARDPLQATDVAHPARLARQLAGEGDEVVLVLLEDAVTLARAGHVWSDALHAASEVGVRVLVEDEAASRRAVRELVEGAETVELGGVVDLLVGWSERQAWL